MISDQSTSKLTYELSHTVRHEHGVHFIATNVHVRLHCYLLIEVYLHRRLTYRIEFLLTVDRRFTRLVLRICIFREEI